MSWEFALNAVFSIVSRATWAAFASASHLSWAAFSAASRSAFCCRKILSTVLQLSKRHTKACTIHRPLYPLALRAFNGVSRIVIRSNASCGLGDSKRKRHRDVDTLGNICECDNAAVLCDILTRTYQPACDPRAKVEWDRHLPVRQQQTRPEFLPGEFHHR